MAEPFEKAPFPSSGGTWAGVKHRFGFFQVLNGQVPLHRPQCLDVESLVCLLSTSEDAPHSSHPSAGEGEEDHQQGRDRGTSHGPLYQPASRQNDSSSADRLGPQPAFKVVGQRFRGVVAPTWVFLQAFETNRFQVTVNKDFAGVIRGCADRGQEGTWITGDMIRAYETLHELGHAHSVEVWQDQELAGGLYGVAIGGFFAGESMFSRQSDASKAALVFLLERLRQRAFQLFDIQMLTDHTARLGAIEIPRSEYLARLRRALSYRASLV